MSARLLARYPALGAFGVGLLCGAALTTVWFALAVLLAPQSGTALSTAAGVVVATLYVVGTVGSGLIVGRTGLGLRVLSPAIVGVCLPTAALLVARAAGASSTGTVRLTTVAVVVGLLMFLGFVGYWLGGRSERGRSARGAMPPPAVRPMPHLRKSTWALTIYAAIFGPIELGLIYTALTEPGGTRALSLDVALFGMVYFVVGAFILGWIRWRTRAR